MVRVRSVVVPLVVAAMLAVVGVTTGPVEAAARPKTLSERTRTVTWSGTVDRAAPMGCGQLNLGCDTVPLTVDAPKGAWVTVSAGNDGHAVRVTRQGRVVGSAGTTVLGASGPASTTFKHIASGALTYQVAIGSIAGSPAYAFAYRATARLAGTSFDRTGDCGPTPGLDSLDSGTTTTRTLRVRLVAEPKDAAPVRRAGKALVEIFDRIAVPVTVSYDFMPLAVDGSGYPYEQVRKRYGGVRPGGVDVVHVMTDEFAGGYADCIGGIAFAERAFSVGNVHYTLQGTAAVDRVPGGMVAAHEISHLLGAQHQQFNCVEAAPQQARQPATDGWTGPCTLMSPAALLASETFSTLERNTIRSFVRTYAGRG